MTLALYPGSFDPVTKGHLNTAYRAARCFGTVVMAVFDRPQKNVLFSVDERVDMIQRAIQDNPAIQVTSYSNLTVEYARQVGAMVIVRGLRDSIDFEHEFQMAQINQKIDPDMDVIFFMASRKFSFLSSTVVREIALLGGDVSEFVPSHVVEALQRKYA